jgi:flagellar basal-body rod protein FlgB
MPLIPDVSLLENYIALNGKRETVIASNMANVDTPGYRTKDIDFQKELSRAMESAQQDAPMNQKVALHDVRGLLERPDGNNVDLDHESMQLAETQLQYQMGTQLLKTNFHEVLSAINGGE